MSLSVKPFNFGLNQICVVAHSRLILVSTGISLPGTIDNKPLEELEKAKQKMVRKSYACYYQKVHDVYMALHAYRLQDQSLLKCITMEMNFSN